MTNPSVSFGVRVYCVASHDGLRRSAAYRRARWGMCVALTLGAVFTGASAAQTVLGFSDPAALNTNADSDFGNDYAPQVTTDGRGNWVAVWESNDTLGATIGTDIDILVSRSTDNGATWTTPAALNTNAASDSRDDVVPQVTTDDGGNWVAVWESNDDLGGTIGMDRDILVSRSMNNGATWMAAAQCAGVKLVVSPVVAIHFVPPRNHFPNAIHWSRSRRSVKVLTSSAKPLE